MEEHKNVAAARGGEPGSRGLFFFFFFNHTKGEIPGPSAELTLWKSTRTSPPREEASRGAGDGWRRGQESPETPFWLDSAKTCPARLSLASAASQYRRPHRRRRPPFWSPKFGASAASAAPAARLRGRGDPVRAPPFFFFFFFNHTKGEIPGPSAELTLWKSTRTSPPREEASRGAGDGWHEPRIPGNSVLAR